MDRLRIGTWLVLYLLVLLIQVGLLPQIFPMGYVPQAVLSLTVLIALHETPKRGMWAGLLGGLMQDLWAGRLIGLNALTFALLGYGVAWVQQKIVRDPIFVPGLIAGLSQVVVVPFQWALLYVFGYHFSWLIFSRPLPVWILFSMLFTPALGGIVGFSARRNRRRPGYRSLSL